MLIGLQDEIDKYPGLVGASNEIKLRTLNNTNASVDVWVVQDSPSLLAKAELLAMCSTNSILLLRNWMEEAASNNARVFKMLFDSSAQFDLAHPKTREMVKLIHTESLITTEEKDSLLRIGERLQTRPEELFGRALTMEDFE